MKVCEPRYLLNQYTLKDFGLYKKLVIIKCQKNKGFEDKNSGDSEFIKRLKANAEVQEDSDEEKEIKSLCNISRAKQKYVEIATCNNWDYFITLTFDQKKCDRKDLKKLIKNLTQWVRDENKRFPENSIKYHFIPELHEDGINWHLHGFLKGISEDMVRMFTDKEKLPVYVLDKLKEGRKLYEWIGYRAKFGYCVLEPIKSHEAAAHYATKYITKNLERTVKALGAHLFYSSNGLDRAKLLKKGTMSPNIIPDWENDYVIIKKFPKEFTLEQIEKFLDNNTIKH